MENRISISPSEELRNNLGTILNYLESDRKFKDLTHYPADKELGRHIRIKYKVEEDSEELEDSLKFFDHVKRIQEGYECKREMAELIKPFGSSREEVIKNLSREVSSSQVLLESYRDFLRSKSREKEGQDQASFGMNRISGNYSTTEKRFSLEETANSRLYTKLRLQDMDVQYLNLNVFGGNN